MVCLFFRISTEVNFHEYDMVAGVEGMRFVLVLQEGCP